MPTPRFIPLAELHEDPANVRKHGDRNKASVRASILEFGQVETLVVQRGTGRVLGGNCRLGELRALGREGAWCMEVDVEGIDATRLALALNRTAELAEWDADALGRLLSDLAPEDLGDLWTTEEVGALCATDLVLEPEPAEEDEDAPLPVPAEPVSRLGEVYELGPHRLVCGSSTDAAAWGLLLGDERLRMVWTDPPYGVSYEGGTDRKLTIQNDSLKPEQLRVFLTEALGAAMAYATPGAAFYVAAPCVVMYIFVAVLVELGLFRHELIWSKDAFALGRSDHHYRHEPIFYGWNPGAAHYWCGRRDIDTIFEVPRPKRSEEHPTMKPVALIRQHIEHSSEPGWLIGDGFGGSGSTLLAAAESGRIARLIELDPRYCDVIRRRWTRWARANNRDPGPGYLDNAEPVASSPLPR